MSCASTSVRPHLSDWLRPDLHGEQHGCVRRPSRWRSTALGTPIWKRSPRWRSVTAAVHATGPSPRLGPVVVIVPGPPDSVKGGCGLHGKGPDEPARLPRRPRPRCARSLRETGDKLWSEPPHLLAALGPLAYAGVSRGHTTVAEAVGDIACRGWVVDLWDEAVQHLPPAGLDLDEYRQALLDRFGNSRIRHELAQVGTDGVTKLRVRIVPVAMAERAAGRDAAACARVVGAWIATVLSGRGLKDSHASPIAQARAAGHAEVHRNLLALVDADLARDDAFVTRVKAAAESFTMDQTDNEEGKTA